MWVSLRDVVLSSYPLDLLCPLGSSLKAAHRKLQSQVNILGDPVSWMAYVDLATRSVKRRQLDHLYRMCPEFYVPRPAPQSLR